MAVSLSEDEVLSATAGRRLRPSGRGGFSAVGTDSRALPEGCLFVALKGERFDAHDFLVSAQAKGAGAAVVCRGTPPVDGTTQMPPRAPE